MTEVASAATIQPHEHDETHTAQTGRDSVESRYVPAYENSTIKAGEDPETPPRRALEKLEAISNRPRDKDNVQENGHEDKERVPEEKEAGEYVNEGETAVLGSTDVEKASEKPEPEKSLLADVIATEQQPNDIVEGVDSSEPATKLDEQVKEATTEPVTESAPVHTAEPETGLPNEMSAQAGNEGLTVETESADVADVTKTTIAIADTDATDANGAKDGESESVKQSEETLTLSELRGEQTDQEPVEGTGASQRVEDQAEPKKKDEVPVVAEHATESEAVVPAAAKIEPSPEVDPKVKPVEVPQQTAKEEDAADTPDHPVVEAPSSGEDLVQSEIHAVDASAESSGLEPTKDETINATAPEVEALSDVPKKAEETAAQEASVKEEETPTDGQPAEEEAPAPDTIEEPTLNADGEANTKPQEAERTVEPQVEVSDEVQKKAEERTAEKDVPEAADAGIGGESVTVKESEPTEIVPAAAEGGTKPKEVVVARAVETATDADPQVDAPPPQAEMAETSEVTARQAYELAHARTNDEVSFSTPTEEELKAASFEDVSAEKGDESSAVETKEVEGASESQEPPVSESAAAPAPEVNGAEGVAKTGPEAKGEQGGPGESEEPQSETIRPLEEEVNPPGEQAETREGTASDAKEGTAEAEVVEGTVDKTDAAASAELSSEPQIVKQVTASDISGLNTQDDEPPALAEVPSEEVTAAKEEVEDVSPTGPSEGAIAHTEDAPTLTQEEASAPVEQVFVSEPATTEAADKEPPAAEEVVISVPVEQSAENEAAGAAPQPETAPEAPIEEHDLKTAAEAELEEQEVDVPDVLVETPTPMSETLTISSDEEDDDAPLEEGIAKVIGITPGETTKSPALDTTSPEARTEDEVVMPTEAKDGTTSEVEGREVPAIESEDLETPSQSVFLERPQTGADDAATGPTANAEAPERPKSPWTPSYSVTTQGLSPMHPQAELLPVTEDISNASTGGTIEEKANVESDTIPPASSVEEGQAMDSALVESSAADIPALETIATQTIPTETAPAVVTESGQSAYLSDAAVEQAPILATEDRETTASDEVAAAEDIEIPVESAPASLSVDTKVEEVPERPKSPWTPSYSVTKMGPGVPEPDELHLDQDAPFEDRVYDPQEIQQVASSEAPAAENKVNETRDAAESAPDIERSKSPYPPAYSVTQMGPGTIDVVDSVSQLEEPTSPISESGPASVVDSNEPEAPLTPRSDLGIVTPGFDTLSEVSESSHIPMPPSTPRSDPETSSLLNDEVKTPLMTVPENQGESVSPLQTPLMSASKVLESTEQLTEFAVSGFDADVADTSATNSWVKENGAESDSRAEDSAVSPTAVDAVGVDQSTKETAPPENDTVKVLQQNSAETVRAAEEPSAPPGLGIPKLDVTPAPPAAQPLIVTNTFSTDSAYTQTSDALSPSQETETTITTPDVESPPVSKLHPSSDLESEAATSDSTVRPLPNTSQKGSSLGVTHTLAMRSFPTAFTDPETSPSTEQPNEPPITDTHEVDDLLSPLPADARRRLESTASSLAFPGGWVSSPRKERTSLEVATGEFSKPVVEGNPIVTSPIAEHPSEQKESKWRCVIM